MVLSFLALVQVAGLAADIKGSLQVSDTTQTSLRPVYLRDRTAVDVENTPTAELRLAGSKSSVLFGYSPRFMLRDVTDENAFLLLHTGYVSYSHLGPRYRFTLAESGSYGQQTFTSLSFVAAPQVATAPVTSPRVDVVPRTDTVLIASELTSATLEYRWTRRWASSFVVSYGISGGVDAKEQAALAQQKTASTAATLDHSFGRADHLVSSLSVANSIISDGRDNWLVMATEGWTHRLTRSLSSSITAGAAWVTTKLPATRRESRIRPVGSLGLDGAWQLVRRRNYAVTLQFGSSLTPTVNPVNGELQERGQAGTTLRVTSGKASVAGTLDASQTFPPGAPDAIRVLGAGAVATYTPTKAVELALGYRSAWQTSNAIQIYSVAPHLWTAFAAVTLRLPPVAF